LNASRLEGRGRFAAGEASARRGFKEPLEDLRDPRGQVRIPVLRAGLGVVDANPSAVAPAPLARRRG
jgi:hypothetical protein